MVQIEVHDEKCHNRSILSSGIHFRTWCSAVGCFPYFSKTAAARYCAREAVLQFGSPRCLFVSLFNSTQVSQVQCCSCGDVHAWAPSMLYRFPATFIDYCSRQQTSGGVSFLAIRAGTCDLLGCGGRVLMRQVGTHAQAPF